MDAHLKICLAKQKPEHASIKLIFHACDSVHANTITPSLLLLVFQDYCSAKSSKLTAL